MAKTINLTDRDIDYISRVVDTEVPRSVQRRDPKAYRDMVRAVVDTVTNRLGSDGFPNSVTGVLNQKRQFSKITGPADLTPYGSVQKTPKAAAATEEMVRQHIENRVAGAPSTIGDAVNYANPNFSSPSNRKGWIDSMIDAGAKKLGIDDDIHYHGNAPGAVPASEYSLSLNGVDNTHALANVATPTFADRAGTGLNQADSATGIMSAVNPASTMSVERGMLADPSSMGISGGLLGGTTPGASASSTVSAFRDPQAEMAGLQQQANQTRQRMEMANGSLNLNQDQIANAMGRREQAMGILGSQPIDNTSVAGIEAVSPTQISQPQQEQPKNDLASAYGQMANTMQDAGVLGLSGMKVMDPNDILGVGKLAPAPGLAVESMPTTDMTASVADQPTMTGPVTTEIADPVSQTTARRATNASPTVSGGLLSADEAAMVEKQRETLAAQGKNRKEQVKKGLGSIGGGILGGLALGPVGAILGGLLGPSVFNGNILGQLGTGVKHFPAAPREVSRGDGRLSDYGRGVHDSSDQFRDAYDRGDVGLW